MECTFYLAEGCNLRCKYCYEGIQKRNVMMNNKTVEQALDFLVKNALHDEKIQLVLLGGEPLLNKPAFFHVIDTIHNRYEDIREKFSIEMTTNGILLDEMVIKAVKEEKINLSVSIDGCKESNGKNRSSIDGEDKFPFIMKNINRMLRMGVQRVHISYNYYADWTEEELSILDKQMRSLDELYLNDIADTENLILNLYDFKYTTFFAKRPIMFCSAGSNAHFVVNCSGEVFPCNYVTNEEYWNIGNIRKGIDETIFRKHVKKHVKQKFLCKSCEIAFTCLATRCGFLNYRTTGLLNEPGEISCRLEHILYEHDLEVFQKLYNRKAARIIKYIDIGKEYGIEPNECVKNMFI